MWLQAENQYVCVMTVSHFALGSWVLEFSRLLGYFGHRRGSESHLET